MISCMIIEDEALASKRLKLALEEAQGWHVCAHATSYEQAKEMLLAHQPQVCFVDIDIIGGNGIDLVKETQSVLPCLWIFTTAHSEFACDAFALNAVDYLLKPFSNERLQQVLHKAVTRLALLRQRQQARTLRVKSHGQLKNVDVESIFWIKGAANYAEIHCQDTQYLYRETLCNLERQLDPSQFVRVHRGAMVNLNKVCGLSAETGRYAHVQLSNGEQVRISQAHKSSLFAQLGLEQR